MKKTLLYKNGRSLSYAEYGDPDGFPVLVQHGMIASINDGHLFRALTETGARLISIARPGYGDSSPYEMKHVGEWGEIVSILVDKLGLAQLDVLGISSGAPYAYAIGFYLQERVRNLFILSGTPALYDKNVLALWPYPSNQGAKIPDLQRLAYELFFSHLTPQEQEQDDIRDSMRNDCFGIALDLKIRVLDWGFQLPEVKSKVYMRHSRMDGAESLKMAEMTARLLPDCHLEVREKDPHFSQEVLDDFINTVMVIH